MVNENSPLMPSSTSVSRVAGSSRWVCFHAGAKSAGVKSSTDGMAVAVADGARCRSASTGIGR